jgi:hypothetical protein
VAADFSAVEAARYAIGRDRAPMEADSFVVIDAREHDLKGATSRQGANGRWC